MTTCRIAVKLKSPDPQAVTALNTIQGMGLQLPPVKLNRYDLWEFELPSGDRSTTTEMVSHFTDIVNPNKQIWTFADPSEPLPGVSEDLKWTGVVVSDTEDARGANWAGILKRRGFPVSNVKTGVLWMFGYLKELDDSLVGKLALDLSVSESRTGGLLSNPIFQEVHSWT